MKKKFSINNMLVKTKITMFSAVMLIFMIIIAGVGLFASNSINKARSKRYDTYAMGEYYLSEAFSNFCNIKVRVRNILFMYYDDPDNLQEQETKIANYKQAVYENLGLFEDRMDALSQEIRNQYQKVEDTIEEWFASTDEDIEMAKKDKVEEAVDDLMGEGRVLADQAEAELAELVVMMEEASEANAEYVENELNVLTIILIVVAVIAVIVTFAYAALLIKGITVPVNKLVVAAKELSAGNVDVDCRKIHDDDLGMLMDEFAGMAANIREQASIADTVARGDMTISVRPRSDKDLLGNALCKLVADNNETLGNIKEATMQVTVGSEQVASASQSLAQGATEQASALQEVTASMNEIAERIKQNASEASQADELARNAMTMAISGNDQMKSMIGAMNDINESSETISKVIKTIDDIAFQTNILALNAAVEAARAGVHGKGFAVVAEEVRNLAAKSAAAASETESMIEDSIHKVNNGTKIAEGTAQALDQIVTSIEQVGNLISAIATASNDQATAVSQVDQAIGQVSQVVQTNSATSEQCAAASEELSNQAATLRTLVANYRLLDRNKGGFGMGKDVGASFSAPNQNEQIISLNGEFGKY